MVNSYFRYPSSTRVLDKILDRVKSSKKLDSHSPTDVYEEDVTYSRHIVFCLRRIVGQIKVFFLLLLGENSAKRENLQTSS